MVLSWIFDPSFFMQESAPRHEKGAVHCGLATCLLVSHKLGGMDLHGWKCLKMKGGGRLWILATDHTAPLYRQRTTPQPKLPLWHVI